jgi:plasmid maintenance system killer protein
VGEIVPYHIEIRVGQESLAFIYKPIACHNYNAIQIDSREVLVATIDTILSFYFAFYYADQAYYYRDRLICMAKFLFELEERNRLAQKGLLKRFSIQCIGEQPSVEDIRAEKARKFKELKGDRSNPEYEMWFLKYNPAEVSIPKLNKTYKKSAKKPRKRTVSKPRTRKTQKSPPKKYYQL